MALCRFTTYTPNAGEQKKWGWVREGQVYTLDDETVKACLQHPGPQGLNVLAEVIETTGPAFTLEELDTLPDRFGHPALAAPVTTGMEVWAAGVTYESSKFARMAESADGGDFYAKVYVADRPELFFKATPHRTVGPNDRVRLRNDSTWDVPEPELAVLIAANTRILGFTVGNDMSSRSIEGENPLYLPQAKVYHGACALGPTVIPVGQLDPQNLGIILTIRRGGEVAYKGETSTARMRRTVEELAGWLFRANGFPMGVVLLTGTGLIPPEEFTLQSGDDISIEIEKIGTLRNHVA